MKRSTQVDLDPSAVRLALCRAVAAETPAAPAHDALAVGAKIVFLDAQNVPIDVARVLVTYTEG